MPLEEPKVCVTSITSIGDWILAIKTIVELKHFKKLRRSYIFSSLILLIEVNTTTK